jgi:hypothetical protein
MHTKLHQKDVKCAFLNGYLNKEVYIDQAPDLEMKSFQIMFFILDTSSL